MSQNPTSQERPIDPNMQKLWACLEPMAAVIDKEIEMLCGDRYGFQLLVFPKKTDYAMLTIGNAKEMSDHIHNIELFLEECKKQSAPSADK